MYDSAFVKTIRAFKLLVVLTFWQIKFDVKFDSKVIKHKQKVMKYAKLCDRLAMKTTEEKVYFIE